MAPILVFTAEELWVHMPGADARPASGHLTQLPEVEEGFLDDELAKRWESILLIRGEVSKALEEARTQKIIGHALDAAVSLSIPEALSAVVKPDADELRTVFIVSKVNILTEEGLSGGHRSTKIPGLAIQVDSAPGEKCERCWIHEPSVGADALHKTICARCLRVLVDIEN
jgi:isoleucyl-tRNA synthetase